MLPRGLGGFGRRLTVRQQFALLEFSGNKGGRDLWSWWELSSSRRVVAVWASVWILSAPEVSSPLLP